MTDEKDAKSDLPASVIFMEMMRRAATRRGGEDGQADEAIAEAVPVEAGEGHAAGAEAGGRQGQRARSTPPRPPMTEDERRAAADLEAQRVKRVQRRKTKRRTQAVSLLGGLIRAFLLVSASAILMATILSLWTDASFLRTDMRRSLQAMIADDEPTPAPTAMATPNFLRRIGIVSGHRGVGQEATYDPGAVCPDGLTENEINFNVSQRVIDQLRARGYTVELLDEFDPRLNGYSADALVSIHANTCRDFGEVVSGFLVAKADAKPEGGPDTRLAECIATHYGLISGLERREGLTEDMTDYHNFREIDPLTPAAIIELGFMLADRQIMTEQPDLLARGITEGVICFLDPTAAILGAPSELPTPVNSEAQEG